ncbi:phosphotransferase family protein [Thioalkalivibrio sp. ALJ16]|uniref:phosphotransferase family protein n=1 Tax=Thioalkalivibrio sp. ALJ16 TaxID=1158762 RepID=UPI0018CB2860|nr:aminoglycoside phosphotransferase family protein [Thioalkalivibrio sp. ALJ16]
MTETDVTSILRESLGDELRHSVQEIQRTQTSRRKHSESTTLYRVRLSNNQERWVWVKRLNDNSNAGISEDRTTRDYDLNKWLYETFDPSGPFRVPRPLAFSPEHRFIVTEHVPGKCLQGEITREARRLPLRPASQDIREHMHRAGQWLHAFQSATEDYYPGKSSGLDPLPIKNEDRTANQTLSRLEQLVRLRPTVFDEVFASSVERSIDHSMHQIHGSKHQTRYAICSTHGDFFAGNLIFHGPSVTGIDFTGSTWGSPWFNVSYFCFHLETALNKYIATTQLAREARKAFLEGYGYESTGTDFWQSSPEMQLNYVSHCISRLLSLSESKWLAASPRELAKRYALYKTKKELLTHVKKL